MTSPRQENQESGTVESVILALQRVITLLDRIKNTIEESSCKIPKASVQLETVTQATEMATVEILDVLDTMAQKITGAENRLSTLSDHMPAHGDQAIVDEIKYCLQEAKEDALTITMSLQIQDITAQKIAAANHLIESVRVELLRELNYFQSTNDGVLVPERIERTQETEEVALQTFDKNASFRKSADHQDQIDQVVLNWKANQSAPD